MSYVIEQAANTATGTRYARLQAVGIEFGVGVNLAPDGVRVWTMSPIELRGEQVRTFAEMMTEAADLAERWKEES